MKLEIGKFGEEVALLLPQEILSQTAWESGDVFDGEYAEGVLKISRIQTKHDRAMEIANKLMDEYHETLKALAKS